MRSPDPFVQRHSAHINIIALCLAALGLMTLLAHGLQLFGSVTCFVTFVAWVYLKEKVKPRITDYLEYLKQAAEEDGHVDWLDQVEAEFNFRWQIKSLEALTDG